MIYFNEIDDNIIFFVGGNSNIDIPDIHTVISFLFNLELDSIIFAPAMEYEWDAPEFYDKKTVIKWHKYKDGDVFFEFEILLGGNRLKTEKKINIWSELSKELQSQILIPITYNKSILYYLNNPPLSVNVKYPEYYDNTGPILLEIIEDN